MRGASDTIPPVWLHCSANVLCSCSATDESQADHASPLASATLRSAASALARATPGQRATMCICRCHRVAPQPGTKKRGQLPSKTAVSVADEKTRYTNNVLSGSTVRWSTCREPALNTRRLSTRDFLTVHPGLQRECNPGFVAVPFASVATHPSQDGSSNKAPSQGATHIPPACSRLSPPLPTRRRGNLHAARCRRQTPALRRTQVHKCTLHAPARASRHRVLEWQHRRPRVSPRALTSATVLATVRSRPASRVQPLVRTPFYVSSRILWPATPCKRGSVKTVIVIPTRVTFTSRAPRPALCVVPLVTCLVLQ